jgi:hypothetical protein
VFILHEIEQLAGSEIAEIIGIPLGTVASRLSEALDDFATHLEAGSDLADSLMIAARAEQPSEAALQRALLAFGPSVSALVNTAEEETSAVSVPGAVSADLAPAMAVKGVFAISPKWLGIGLVIGLLATSAVYALSDALASSHATAR